MGSITRFSGKNKRLRRFFRRGGTFFAAAAKIRGICLVFFVIYGIIYKYPSFFYYRDREDVRMKLPIKYRALGYAAAAVGAACIGFYFGAPSGDGVCMVGRRGDGGSCGDSEEAFLGEAKRGAGGIRALLRITADGAYICQKDDAAPCAFRRYLEICREYGVVCFIDIRETLEETQLCSFAAQIREGYDLSRCVLRAASPEPLVCARKLFPELGVMLISSDGAAADLAFCIDGGIDIDVPAIGVSRRTVREFRRHGRKVAVRGAGDPFTLCWCRWMEPDYIESDVY